MSEMKKHLARLSAAKKTAIKSAAVSMVDTLVFLGGRTRSSAVYETAREYGVSASTIWRWLNSVQGVTLNLFERVQNLASPSQREEIAQSDWAKRRRAQSDRERELSEKRREIRSHIANLRARYPEDRHAR